MRHENVVPIRPASALTQSEAREAEAFHYADMKAKLSGIIDEVRAVNGDHAAKTLLLDEAKRNWPDEV